MWQPPSGSFIAEPLKPAFQPWSKPLEAQAAPEPAWRSDDGLKRLFGIALAKTVKPFAAALEVFPDDTNAALWASWHWLSDPLVVASKDAYAQNIELSEKLLDKDALSAKLLTFAEEKDPSGRFYICEAKDRLAAYKLFAEVQGFIGKLSIDASTNHFTNNELKLVLVKVQEQQALKPIIDDSAEITTELPTNLKLVGTSR